MAPAVGGTTTARRLFVAVRPNEPATGELLALPRSDQPGVRWSAPENWHVTLRFLGAAPPADIIAALSSMTPPKPRTVQLGPAITLLGNAIVVPVEGLDDVASSVAEATSGHGAAERDRPFVGHLTLGRLRTPNATCDLLGRGFRSRFTLGEIELLASEQEGGQTRYRALHRWAVQDRSGSG